MEAIRHADRSGMSSAPRGRGLGRDGFTLLEIMVAVTVTTLLLLTIYGVFSSVSRAKDRLETEGEGYHQARVLFARIGREIRGTYYNPRHDGTLFDGGESEDGNPFLALSTTATTPQGGARGGIVAVRYELIEDPEADDGRKVMMRSESPPVEDGEGLEREGYRLATGIREMQLRFYRNGEWLEEWRAEEDGLPDLVEVSLVVTAGEDAVPFRTAFEVPAIQVTQ